MSSIIIVAPEKGIIYLIPRNGCNGVNFCGIGMQLVISIRAHIHLVLYLMAVLNNGPTFLID